jgi:dihydrofolate reductase
MARKIKLYIASSLNSRIASTDGGVEWLESIPTPEKQDYGYAEFYNSIDTTIMGYNTYAQITSWDIPFPYPDKKNYVLSNRKDLENNEHVEFVRDDQIKFIKALKETEGNDIWLIGGGQINTLVLNAKLVDEIIVHIMPLVLDGGIEIFEGIPAKTSLKLINSKTYISGVVELRYRVES